MTMHRNQLRQKHYLATLVEDSQEVVACGAFYFCDLYAVAAAFSDGSPVALLLHALANAGVTGCKRLFETVKQGQGKCNKLTKRAILIRKTTAR